MRLTLTCLCLFAVQFLKADVVTFQMSAFGIKFGTMTVTREQEDDSTEVYRLKASGYLKVLWMERRDETKNEVRFCNGKLVSSTYSQVENGKMAKWTHVRANQDHLLIDSHKGKRTVKGRPVASVIMLYFNYPERLQSLFNESDANFLAVKNTAPNTFETKTTEGKTVYRYTQGAIKEVEFHIPAAVVYAKRIQN